MKHILIFCSVFFAFTLLGQQAFTLEFVPTTIKGIPPLHSYAHAQWDGKWLILGGQTREDWDFSHPNLQVIVVDPVADTVWMADVDNLSYYVQDPEQIASCYAQYFQSGEMLYLAGGYGYCSHTESYITFPYLTALNIRLVIEDIVRGQPYGIGEYFTQIYDDDFAVMEGYLTHMDDHFYLVGGVQFFGEYVDAEPVFHQVPSEKVVRFQLLPHEERGLIVKKSEGYNYGKDFNELLVTYAPQVFDDQSEGVTMFSNGETEEGTTTRMNVFNVGYEVVPMPEPQFPHYHSTVIPIYDASSNIMHNIFLGGCNDYYCEKEDIYGKDKKIESINDLQVDGKGNVKANLQLLEAYYTKGRDAQFLINSDIKTYDNGVLKLDALPTDRTLIGYIYGGADSVNPLIFQNGDILALATDQVFKVYLIKTDGDLGQLEMKYPAEGNGAFTIYVPGAKN